VSDPSVSFQAVVSDLNHMNYKLGVYREDWSGLPAGVKTAIKTATIAGIDQAIVALAAVKVDIQNL